ncbi:hypothetical protein JCM14036_03180 [Desulfotomaculum defluvii]
MLVQFQRAQRKRAKLRLALAGPAGAGKTYSALLIAFGIGGRVAMIDTERGSGELYSHLGEYDVCTIEAPFLPEKYVEAIKVAEGAGYDIIIIDSLTHAWAGTGGVLDIHGYAADKSGNSWTAWRQVTPRHNELVDALLQSKCHIIATLRSKMDHIQTTENGKTVVKKVGMNPIQRDGMEYEFGLFLDLDQSHMASSSKDRTSLFDGQVFKPSREIGRKLVEWLDSGVPNSAEIIDFPPTGPIKVPGPGSPAWEALYGEKKEKTQDTKQAKPELQINQQQSKQVNLKSQGAKAQMNQDHSGDDPFWNSVNQMNPPVRTAGGGRRRLF